MNPGRLLHLDNKICQSIRLNGDSLTGLCTSGADRYV